MMESEEITKLVDGVYKNILEKFNPGARQLITAGKAYLKALHGAASASRLFNEALAKIAMNAQQNGTNDIGSALMNVVSVYKEIQDHQMNILKAFYVDLLVPLETNLEKDTKVVQYEQKKFLQQHKVRMDNYHKAVTTMKKQRKKKNTPENTEKEIKSIQQLEEQKKKLELFCEQSFKNAMTQERRRYGFVLERQCSIAKHWMAHHTNGQKIIENNLDNWLEVAASREVIPTNFETNFTKRMEKIREDDHHSGSSQMKKSRSIDAPFGDMRTLSDREYAQNSLPRAKSDFNLTTTSSNENWDQRPVVKALYAYMPSGENQLPFAESDRIALVGNKAKGWQFGENLRTQMFGWFPIAYTNAINVNGEQKRDSNYENVQFERNGHHNNYNEYLSDNHLDSTLESDTTYRRRNTTNEESSPTRMFGDTLMFRNQKRYRGTSGVNPKPGPPPTLPAPVPSSNNSSRPMLNVSQSFCSPNGPPTVERRNKHKSNNPAASHSMMQMKQKPPREGTAKTSLHSSNDSGFANEPPPQPEVDYSDEEHSRVPIRRRTDASFQSARNANSWTLSRNFKNSNDHPDDHRNDTLKASLSFENVIASDDEMRGQMVKRTKSFWKFKKSDDILAGMSLWRHRDLVQPPINIETDETETIIKKDNHNDTSTLDKRMSTRNSPSNLNTLRKNSVTTMENYDDENLYGMTPVPSPIPLPVNYAPHQKPSRIVTPKEKGRMMQTIAIDIDDDISDAERMNSIKRQPIEYREQQRQSQQQNHHQSQNQQIQSINHKKLNNSKQIHSKQQQQQQQQSQHQHHSQQKLQQQQQQQTKLIKKHDEPSSDSDDNGTLKMSDVNSFFDDENASTGMVIKTFKRQDILKQYYTSEDDSDTEVKSTSSDPYDCIVINDHLVQKDEKLNRRHQTIAYQQQQQQEQHHHQQQQQQQQLQSGRNHEPMDFQTFRTPQPPILALSTTTPTIITPTNTNISTLKQANKISNKNKKLNNDGNDRLERYNGGVNMTSNIVTTATILPRTRLMKSTNNNLTLEKNLKKSKEINANMNGDKDKSFAKSYGPWYDFWDQQDMNNSKIGQHSKIMKG